MSGAAVNRGTTQIQCFFTAPSSSNKLLTLTQPYGNAYSLETFRSLLRSDSISRFIHPFSPITDSLQYLSGIFLHHRLYGPSPLWARLSFYKVYNRKVGLSIVFLNLFFKHCSAVRINADGQRKIFEFQMLDTLAPEVKKRYLLAFCYAL